MTHLIMASIMVGCTFANGMWCGVALYEGKWRWAAFYAFVGLSCGAWFI